MIVKHLNLLVVLTALVLLLGGCGGENPTRTSTTEPVIPPVTTYSISGTISSAVYSAADGDTNDPSSPVTANNLPANAQLLDNPFVLGGYSTAVPTGVSGDRFATTTDVQDWYRVTLAAGQVVTLTIADHDGNAANIANPDLDLFLVDPIDTAIDVQTSEGYARQEVITIATGGEYFLQVYNFNGSSNYTLSVGQTPAALSTPALRIEDEFVPGEVIVRLREPQAGAAAVPTPQPLAELNSTYGLRRKAGAAGGAMLFQFDPTVQPSALAATSALRSKRGGSLEQQTKRATIDRVKALRRRADVASADLNYIRKPLLVPNDPLYVSQWNEAMINLPPAWDQTTGNANVVVAVVDTGVLFGHPDLAGRLCVDTDPCAGYDFVSNVTSAGDGDGIDPDPTDPGDHTLPNGASSFHGTHVAGIVGAQGNNTTGVAGVDWNARLMPVRVLGVVDGTSYDVMQGVRYAAGLSNDSTIVPTQPADVINLSLGGGGFSQAEQDLYTQLHAAGIVVVAAAGNDSSSLLSYPASYAGVVSVSAIDIDGNLAYYSNTGTGIDVTAPGGSLATDRNGDGIGDGIISTGADDSTATLSYNYPVYAGTSMASPQVAGVAALMLALHPTLTAADFDTLLAAGSLTQDLSGDGAATRNDQFGYGLIDAQKGVLAAINLETGGTLPASLAFSPSLLNFADVATSLTVNLANAGGGTLTVNAPTWSAGWITGVSQPTPTADGLGDYQVTIDRTGLTAGVYAATVTFSTDISASYQLQVMVQVGSGGIPNAGYQWIYLLDATSGAVLQSTRAAADTLDGSYSYSFGGLAAGEYLVKSSTDDDHDRAICDAGEACGNYPTQANPAAVTIGNSSRAGIDFVAGFQ